MKTSSTWSSFNPGKRRISLTCWPSITTRKKLLPMLQKIAATTSKENSGWGEKLGLSFFTSALQVLGAPIGYALSLRARAYSACSTTSALQHTGQTQKEEAVPGALATASRMAIAPSFGPASADIGPPNFPMTVRAMLTMTASLHRVVYNKKNA